MKVLRLCLAAMLLLFLADGILVAQGNKKVTKYTYPSQGLVPCNNDYVVGEETIVTTNWDGKVQVRCKGTFTGESGKSYTWSLLENYSMKDFTEGAAFNSTMVVTSVIECEGDPIAYIKIRSHLTVNANGEPTVDFDRGTFEFVCM